VHSRMPASNVVRLQPHRLYTCCGDSIAKDMGAVGVEGRAAFDAGREVRSLGSELLVL
jgi:hypothetical protein